MSERKSISDSLLSHTVTVGLKKGIIHPLGPNCEPSGDRRSRFFDAPLLGHSVRVCFTEWRFDEARVSLALWPSDDVDKWIQCGNAKRSAGEVTVHGRLDRSNGRLRLQAPFNPSVFISKHRRVELLKLLDSAEVDASLRLMARYRRLASAA